MPNESKQGVYVAMPVSFFSSFFRDHLFSVDQSTRKTLVVFPVSTATECSALMVCKALGQLCLSSSETCVVMTHMLQTIKPSVIMLSNCIMLMP